MTVRVDDVIATYMKLRNEKEAIEAEIKGRAWHCVLNHNRLRQCSGLGCRTGICYSE